MIWDKFVAVKKFKVTNARSRGQSRARATKETVKSTRGTLTSRVAYATDSAIVETSPSDTSKSLADPNVNIQTETPKKTRVAVQKEKGKAKKNEATREGTQKQKIREETLSPRKRKNEEGKSPTIATQAGTSVRKPKHDKSSKIAEKTAQRICHGLRGKPRKIKHGDPGIRI